MLDILHYKIHLLKLFLYAQSLEKESYRCILLDKKSILWLKMMKGENEKKLRERLCHCFGGKGIAIYNFSVDCSIEFSSFKKTTNNDVKNSLWLSGWFFFSPFYYSGRQKIDLLFSSLPFKFFIETFYLISHRER